MAFTAAAASISALPTPPRLQYSTTPVASSMASTAAAVSTLHMPCSRRLLHPSPVSSGGGLSLRRRRRRSLTTVYAVLKGWTSVPISGIRPANADKTIFLITLDLSDAPLLLNSYKNPGQYVLTRVPTAQGKERRPSYFSICSAPRSGPFFQLLVRSFDGTTSELLCSSKVGDVVELGPCVGQGFSNPIENLNPPQAAETVLMFAVGEGVSPMRALIEYGFFSTKRENVKLYVGATSLNAMPLLDEFDEWKKTGVMVETVTTEPVEAPFLRDVAKIIVNPDSTGAMLVGPQDMEEEVVGVLTDYNVPHEKILTYQGWNPDY